MHSNKAYTSTDIVLNGVSNCSAKRNEDEGCGRGSTYMVDQKGPHWDSMRDI